MISTQTECQDERRRRLLDAMPAIAWSASAATFRFTYVNPAAETLLGYPTQAWLDEPNFWYEHIHPDDREVAQFCHNETLCARDHELVYRMVAADGRSVWLRDYVKVHVVDGVAVELFGVMVDITREREAEAASVENRENFRRMVELSPDCIGVHVDGSYVYVNQAFVRLLGAKSENEILGRNLFSFVDPAYWDAVHERMRQLRAGEMVPYVREQFRRVDGSLLDVEVAALPLRYGSHEAVQVIARDVTESTRAALKLEEAKRMSSLGQVSASLAHEFNNVLMGIQPFVEIIARSAAPTRAVGDALGHITRAISRGKRASQEILRFANPKEPQLFTIDTRNWLPGFLGQLMAALPPSIALSHSMEPAVRFLLGDREHLEQVLTNLVFNARDAITGPGKIHLDVALTGAPAISDAEFVRISVFDDGGGIPPVMLDRIFEPLYTTKRNGTGLGLAIARRLMEGQGGSLTAENRPEGGAAFHVLVRAADVSFSAILPLAHNTPGVERILIVEDDAAVGAGLETLLQSEGYETVWVRAIAEAAEAARQMNPHVAIIDVNLPDGNGVDLVPVLRAQHEDLPIVISTGHVELSLSDQKQRILSLMKPYELADLLSAIGSVTAAA